MKREPIAKNRYTIELQIKNLLNNLGLRVTAIEAGGGSGTPDASTTVKGLVKLAGQLSGTAALPTVSVYTDGTTITGNGLQGNPLIAHLIGYNGNVITYADLTTMVADTTVYPVGTIALSLNTLNAVMADGTNTWNDLQAVALATLTDISNSTVSFVGYIDTNFIPNIPFTAITIADAQYNDLHGLWTHLGKYYKIQDTVGSFAGGNSLHSYIAQVIFDEATGYGKLSTSGIGYVCDVVGTGILPDLCRIGYDVSTDTWVRCEIDTKSIFVEHEDGAGMNQVNYELCSQVEVSNSHFLNLTSDFYLEVGTKIYNSEIDINSHVGCRISASIIDNSLVYFDADGAKLIGDNLKYGATVHVNSELTLLE